MFFYGRVTNGGNRDANVASSTNWTVSKESDGFYKIVLAQHLSYAPSVTVTIAPDDEWGGGWSPCTAQTWCAKDGEKWCIYVRTAIQQKSNTKTSSASAPHSHSHKYNDRPFSSSDVGFSFSARAGMTRVFDVGEEETLELIPEIKEFNDKKILVLSTEHEALTKNLPEGHDRFHIDKGTVLIGVGTKLKLVLRDEEIEYPEGSGDKWQLTGWTFGGGEGHRGKKWGKSGQGPDYYELGLEEPESACHGGPGHGPATTLYTFAVMGQKGREFISSDPVVRLSNVPPGGLAQGPELGGLP